MPVTLNLKKQVLLNSRLLVDWKAWLDTLLNPLNPDQLRPDEKYVHKSFLELIQYAIDNQEAICKILSESSSSTKSSG